MLLQKEADVLMSLMGGLGGWAQEALKGQERGRGQAGVFVGSRELCALRQKSCDSRS